MKKFIVLFFVVMLVQSCVSITTVSDITNNKASKHLIIDNIEETEGTTFSASKIVRKNNKLIVLDISELSGEVYYSVKTNQDVELKLNYNVKQKNGLLDFAIVDQTGKEITQIRSNKKDQINENKSIRLEANTNYSIRLKGENFKGQIKILLDN